MARISDETRRNNETAIRQVMERLLAGDVPAGGKCDVKTLATQAGVARTGFYPKRNRDGSPRPGPYQHLAEEFERRLAALREAGAAPDPRAAQVERLKSQVAGLKDRLAERQEQLAELGEFKQRALSQIAAQQMEIQRLREALAAPSNLRALPRAQRGAAPYGSCS
ncbi:hypothetical protein J7E91_31525 [Streptomyces sp. ISL-99]|uniref:hypothetical protein n=1 Tax=Streptomyces sp. ISL-99 TaxID=2819193 RepID=UPI001BEA8207|nr:hypothetical protein [Streptomyces sp. ISL-99]MBT2529788.1 hypothetical protein [Streptomyces sp. ISL-99]